MDNVEEAYDQGYNDALDILRNTVQSVAVTAHALGNGERERAALDILIKIERM